MKYVINATIDVCVRGDLNLQGTMRALQFRDGRVGFDLVPAHTTEEAAAREVVICDRSGLDRTVEFLTKCRDELDRVEALKSQQRKTASGDA